MFTTVVYEKRFMLQKLFKPWPWLTALGHRLKNPEVIDASRSWMANFSGVAASIFAFLITCAAYWGAWTADSEGMRVGLLITALVLTHAEAILCLFYLHRVSLEALKAKVGAVEVSLDAQPVQQVTVTSPQTTIVQTAPAVTSTEVLRDGT
jgi:hypothetical protein